MGNDIVKQVDNKEKPKMGFALHPENINRKGRAPKGETLADIAREILNEDLPTGVTRKEAFIRKVMALAYDGNETMIKLIWNYVDGMPKQTQEIIGESGIKVNIVDYGIRTNDKPTTQTEGSTKEG